MNRFKVPGRSAIFTKLQPRTLAIAVGIILFGVTGLLLMQFGSAAVYVASSEAESGVLTSGATRVDPSAGASGNVAVRFSVGAPASTETPAFQQEVVVEGRTRPWDVKFLPTGELLFTERGGVLNVYRNSTASAVTQLTDVKAGGEGGLTGMAIDPLFNQNRQIYLCYNSTVGDVRIVRYRLNETFNGLTNRKDLVTGITANTSGRHSGCRMDFGLDGNLWIGTGDAGIGSLPQDPTSLNGKILRVDREGVVPTGNIGGGFDPRIYSYGHRNTQGIAFFKAAKNGVPGLSAQHGPSTDDEVNELRKGNFGWAPTGTGYNEGVPMTDLTRFPDAISAIWSSGSPTQAPSGMTIINGSLWKGWDGAAAVSMQKSQHLKILRLDANNAVTKEERVLVGTYGRLRAVTQGPDGNLYISTDVGGGNDKIVRLTPQ